MTIKLALTSVPLFRFVAAEHTGPLAAIARVVERAQGEAVLLRGESVPGIYIVADGQVGVYAQTSGQALVHLGRGEAFGEMSFLERTTASATIRAGSRLTRLVLLPQADLATLSDASPDLGRALYHGIAYALSMKLRSTTDHIVAEIQQGRRLLAELGEESVSPDLVATLPEDVRRRNKQVLDSLAAASQLAEEVIRRTPEKAGTINSLQLKLSEINGHCTTFYPRLERQVAALVSFVRTMEQFILQASRD